MNRPTWPNNLPLFDEKLLCVHYFVTAIFNSGRYCSLLDLLQLGLYPYIERLDFCSALHLYITIAPLTIAMSLFAYFSSSINF